MGLLTFECAVLCLGKPEIGPGRGQEGGGSPEEGLALLVVDSE